jgi:hypothetical protein
MIRQQCNLHKYSYPVHEKMQNDDKLHVLVK